MSSRRLPVDGRIDRGRPLQFSFDDRVCTGLAGDTLASALLANGIRRVADSIHLGRPRGIFAAGVEEPNAIVGIDAPCPEPMATATTVELYDGLRAHSVRGRGRLAVEAGRGRYDKVHAHCDVLVIGAGPAGLAAALIAGRAGARVILADDGCEPGGGLLSSRERLDGRPGAEWVADALAELASEPEVRILTRTSVFAAFGEGEFMALERRTDHLGPAAPDHVSRQRTWHIRAREAVVATGAHERPIAFAGNDRPGVMLAGAARTYVNRYAVAPGGRAVVFTTNDSAYAAARELADAGVAVAALVDARPEPPTALARECAARGIAVHGGHVVARVHGHEEVQGVRLAETGAPERAVAELDCDLVLVSGGWNPTVHLHSQAGGRLSFVEQAAAFLPVPGAPHLTVAGAAAGRTSTADCLKDGAQAGAAALRGIGRQAPEIGLPDAEAVDAAPPATLWVVDDPGAGVPWATHFVDLQRDSTVADVRAATGAGMRSVEHVKRYTTIGTAHDQGKTSGVLAVGAVAHALGRPLGELGITTFRAPYTPVSFAALAGRDRGDLHDPIRVTALHGWHEAHGAVFEDVGQWKRPRYFPQDGEDMDAAVARECTAARTGVAMMDASTLGKIDLQGPDAPEFLDRIYTNMMSTVPVGGIRYGLMCRPDGMVFDDGTAIRLAEDRYLITTTTGGAAAVLEWLEEWLQTEWPQLRVWCTSVTDHWTTAALVGPRSREVLSRVAPALAVDNDSFPFMTWRDTTVAGVDARVCRISFSGELAYEINVSGWYGEHVWRALLEAGAGEGITVYGTETMHVLRAEKGFVIVGQDTDGTVTPQDLGMSWVVSKKKEEFIGRRSFERADTRRADRKQLVGLLPANPGELLREGTQLVARAGLGEGVRMLGHVTSSYRSAALERTFALGLLAGGHDRHGETVHAVIGERTEPVTVTAPIFYDPKGERRDGDSATHQSA